MKFLSVLFSTLSLAANAGATPNYAQLFADRDACFMMVDLETGAPITQHNPKRCEERFTPCSSFKIPASAMAFERGVFKDENQVVKWDGVRRDREEINRDLTPMTFMSSSAKWVTEWIMPQLGPTTIQAFLEDFKYGNRDFSGGMKDAWVSSSLKLSAKEQVSFLTRLWKNELALTPRTVELTKKVSFIKDLAPGVKLYGKTGTGCLDGQGCMSRPGKMIGWFVGVVTHGDKTYVFAGNASDLKNQTSPGGPRQRDTTVEILKQMGIAKN